MPSFAWLNDDAEHDDDQIARATALAAKWSSLTHAAEQRQFRADADREEGRDRYPNACEDCPACEDGNYSKCIDVAAMLTKQRAIEAERDLELELVEDKLAAISARIMRPYEHWNEDEAYMQYAERER